MKERIKKLRKTLGLTQQEFADRLGISRGNIATYETREGSPGSSVINLICREFNVSESWLRTGEGEMFIQRTRDDELTAFMDELLAEESTDFRRRLVTALSRLNPEQWDALETVALGLTKEPVAPAFAPNPLDIRTRAEKPRKEWTDAELHAELHAELDRQLAEQREAAENPPAFWRGRSETA